MTQSSHEELRPLQRGVQEKLGQCLLQLQAYEGLMKALVTHHEFSGTSQSLDTRAAETRRKTLGTLINQLVGSFLIPDEKPSFVDASDKPLEGSPWFRFQMQIALPVDDFARIEKELKDFVSLRNELVHHFVERHDLASTEGCRIAEETLVTATCRIKQHFDDLRTWAEDLEQARLTAAAFMQSAMFRDFLVTGKVPWPTTSIVHALREAASELAVGGWAPVSAAGDLISVRYPEELPLRYGCRSWRQVLHESGLFELLYRRADGKRTAWYREKPRVA